VTNWKFGTAFAASNWKFGTAFAAPSWNFGTAFAGTNWKIGSALQSYFSSLFTEQCQTSLNKKIYKYGAFH
jgi:hypothetical protein